MRTRYFVTQGDREQVIEASLGGQIKALWDALNELRTDFEELARELAEPVEEE